MPLKSIDVTAFKLDKIFLLITAVVSAVIFLDGYDYIDGVIFLGMFTAYIVMAFVEMAKEKSHRKLEKSHATKSEKTAGGWVGSSREPPLKELCKDR